jgi:hypothetical protein
MEGTNGGRRSFRRSQVKPVGLRLEPAHALFYRPVGASCGCRHSLEPVTNQVTTTSGRNGRSTTQTDAYILFDPLYPFDPR